MFLNYLPFPVAVIALLDIINGNSTWGWVFVSMPFVYSLIVFFNWLVKNDSFILNQEEGACESLSLKKKQLMTLKEQLMTFLRNLRAKKSG